LNKLNKTKVIYYLHSSFLFFVYNNKYNIKSTIYSALINSKYVFSLIPVENDYLFKKWGINNSILIDNPSSIEYDLVTPSDLSEKNIVLIGRGFDTKKRYDLSIKAMVNIIKEVPDCKMNIISGKYNNLDHLIRNLSLENYVSFTGFHNTIEKYLKKASLHILSSLSESYSLALSETKIYGIPSIICGLDYLALSRGGTVIIYDDNPDTIAKEAIKILKDDKYRKKLGKEARESMIKHKNDLILKKWVKVLLAIYKGDDISYKKYADNTLAEEEAKTIIHNQLQIFRKRKLRFNGLSFEKFESYSF
jgi:glycosyltransferase involved in cell wall biosynthesis